jgi:hypothetical protein
MCQFECSSIGERNSEMDCDGIKRSSKCADCFFVVLN